MIRVDVIPHEEQRYNTVGDWQFIGPDLVIKVSETGNEYYNTLVAIHEIVEAVLCQNSYITGEEVDAFDMSHPDLDEPGEDPHSPYFVQHLVATVVEKLVASYLAPDYEQYENALEYLWMQRRHHG